MRKNWRLVGTMAVLAFLVWASGVWAQQTHRTRDFMRQKLSYTQGIVEGITLEKYDVVITNATSLRNMNLTNAFLALRNPDYVQDMTNFQAKVDTLVRVARNKNLEKSTKAYTEVVRSCVACHKTFRLDQFRQAQHRK